MRVFINLILLIGIATSKATAAPAITAISPTSVTAGAAGFTLTVNGTGFISGSAVQWNGVALQSTLVSATQMTALVGANLVASPGSANMTVFSPGGSQSNAVTFTINPQATGPLTILTASPLPNGAVGVPYSQALSATGGTTPYKGWAVASGTLPPGISLATLGSFLTGLLNGVPTIPGTFTFTVQVTDGSNTVATKQFTLVITGSVSISANGVVNAASYAGGAVSPGEMITIFGSGLGPSTLAALQLDSRGYVSTSLAGTQVLFDGVAAPLIYTVAGQVSAVVPYSVSGKTSAQLQVTYQGQSSNVVAISVTTVAPGIFTVGASGRGPAAVVNQDGTINSAVNPVAVGSYVFVYATGEGQTSPGGIDGKPGGAPAPLPLAQPVTATVGGVNAQVQYAGGVPGLVAGVLQVNVVVPQGVATGNSVPILVNIGGASSQSGVTIAVQGSGTGNPPAPTLASLSPATGAPGSTVPVTLTGTNFVAGASITVSNPGVTVSNVNVVSGTQITATFAIAPSASTGPCNVTVTTAGGTSGPVAFTITPTPSVPTLLSISPSAGVSGTSVPVTLTGTNFVAGAGVSVSNPGVTVSNVNVVSGTQITATFVIAPGASTGPCTVTVTTAGGTSGTVAFTITTTPSVPTLVSISPSAGVPGTSVPVTLTGTNFVAGAIISVSNPLVSVSNSKVASGTQITATLVIAPSAVAGSFNVTVTTPAGTTSAVVFAVNLSSGATISITPSEGATASTALTITVVYAGGSAALDLKTLSILVDGIDSTASFSVTSSSATFSPTLSGGQHVITASIKITDGSLIRASSRFTVTAFRALPQAIPASGPAPLTVNFITNAEYTDGALTLYRWDFNGVGNWDTEEIGPQNHSYQFNTPGIRNAVLQVTNDKGQTTSATVQINVTQGTPAASSAQLKLSTDTLHPQQGDTVDVQTTLGTDATVKVFLKNQAGQAIRTLASGVQRSAGEYKDTWDGKDDSGNVVAEGLYYAVLQYTGAAGTQTLDLSATTGGDQITFDPALTKNWTVTALDGTDCNNYPGCTISPYSNNFMQLTFQLGQALITTAAIRLWNSGTQVTPLFENKPFGRGSHTIYWEGTDQQGNLISPPPYDSFSLSFGGFTLSQNAVFVEEAPQFSNVVASPNYLEPFTGSSSTTSGQPTTISFTISKPATVALQVFSVDSGALLQTITQTNVSAGSSTIAWDGRADNGMFASQGSYRLALRAVDSQGNRSIIRYVLVKVFY